MDREIGEGRAEELLKRNGEINNHKFSFFLSIFNATLENAFIFFWIIIYLIC